MSALALSIDAMMPALGEMTRELKIQNLNNSQLMITMIFLGFSIGILIMGPMSDVCGRRAVLSFGYVIFTLGTLICIAAPDYNLILAGRVLQGLGAAAPRVSSIAIIRDCYSGREMAKIMSITMAMFVLVPTIAPAIGQLILFFSSGAPSSGCC